MKQSIKDWIRGERPSSTIKELAKEIDEKGVEGFFSHEEGELLYYLAAQLPKNAVIVEIGSWKGRSTCWMGRAAQMYSNAKIYAIDPHTGSEEHQKDGPVYTFAEFEKNVSKMGVHKYVHPIVKFSHDAIDDVKEEIDLLFIDGAHDYESVKRDFEMWYPKLKLGGVIAFHDSVGKGWPGVHKLMKEVVFDSDELKDAGFIGTITFARKASQISSKDRFARKFTHFLKTCHEMRKILPQPYGVLEHHFVKRRVQRRWIRKLRGVLP